MSAHETPQPADGQDLKDQPAVRRDSEQTPPLPPALDFGGPLGPPIGHIKLGERHPDRFKFPELPPDSLF